MAARAPTAAESIVAGGEVTTKELVGAFRAIEAYEPATNSWTTLPSMPMPRHGVAGAVIGNRFHLVSGMITSAGAMAMLDPKLEVHTASHDVLELQFNPNPPTAATSEQRRVAASGGPEEARHADGCDERGRRRLPRARRSSTRATTSTAPKAK